jgi:hypothetical protein
MAFIFLSRPKPQNVCAALNIGDCAPELSNIEFSSNSILVVFLRHVGCPFAENMIKQVRNWSAVNSDTEIVVVSHGDEKSTHQWLASIGGLGSSKLIIDVKREIYGNWGIGYSGLMHFLGHKSLFAVLKLIFKGIKNRSASGTRFQKSAIFLIKNNKIIWSHVNDSAEQIYLP